MRRTIEAAASRGARSGGSVSFALRGYHVWHATRAELLRRLGRDQEARAAYDQAIELAGNTAETAYLTRRRDQLGS